jgi:hypothetical protein
MYLTVEVAALSLKFGARLQYQSASGGWLVRGYLFFLAVGELASVVPIPVHVYLPQVVEPLLSGPY